MTLRNKDRTHFMYLTKNKKNNINVGTNLFIKSFIIDNNKNQDIINNLSNSYESNKLKNRIILSSKIKNSNTNISCPSTCLTQQNLTHNIKYCSNNINTNLDSYQNNNLDKILFVRYQASKKYINNNLYLFNNLETYNSNQTLLNTFINLNTIAQYNALIYLIFNLNYYTQLNKNKNTNTNFYNFNLTDFVYKYTNTNNTEYNTYISSNDDICYNKITYKINEISLVNDFSINSDINYNENYFKKIYYKTTDNSTNLLNTNTVYSYLNDISSNNIYLYNKINNISKVDFSIYYNDEFIKLQDSRNLYENNNIDFFVIKKIDINNLNYIKNNRKIIINNENIFINNIKVLDFNNNLYENNSSYGKKTTKKNFVYLSLGNGICGITQHDISYIKLDNFSATTNKKILFSNSISKFNTNANANSNSNIQSLITQYKNNFYLLDNSYNYDYTNTLYNLIQKSTVKDFSIYYNDYIDSIIDMNISEKTFNDISFLSNESSPFFDQPIDLNNYNFVIKDASDVIFDTNYKLRINNNSYDNINNLIYPKYSTYNSTLELDFRYNYSEEFILNIDFNIVYNLSNFDLCNNLFYNFDNVTNDYVLINFYKQNIANYITTTAASDFTNVDCIFIYHDPERETDPAFLYPNNNIEIIRDPNIDTFSKAIELLPGARSSTTNSVFIPAKNGSNLSRKHIQGLIGLNNVPKLLSIQPYDPSFIDGRGFLNQYQIDDRCPNNEEIIKQKINSQKHYSVKDPRFYNTTNNKKQNFANIVKSNARNRSSRVTQTCDICYNTIPIYTPFRLFKTNRGHYLGTK